MPSAQCRATAPPCPVPRVPAPVPPPRVNVAARVDAQRSPRTTLLRRLPRRCLRRLRCAGAGTLASEWMFNAFEIFAHVFWYFLTFCITLAFAADLNKYDNFCKKFDASLSGGPATGGFIFVVVRPRPRLPRWRQQPARMPRANTHAHTRTHRAAARTGRSPRHGRLAGFWVAKHTCARACCLGDDGVGVVGIDGLWVPGAGKRKEVLHRVGTTRRDDAAHPARLPFHTPSINR